MLYKLYKTNLRPPWTARPRSEPCFTYDVVVVYTVTMNFGQDDNDPGRFLPLFAPFSRQEALGTHSRQYLNFPGRDNSTKNCQNTFFSSTDLLNPMLSLLDDGGAIILRRSSQIFSYRRGGYERSVQLSRTRHRRRSGSSNNNDNRPSRHDHGRTQHHHLGAHSTTTHMPPDPNNSPPPSTTTLVLALPHAHTFVPSPAGLLALAEALHMHDGVCYSTRNTNVRRLGAFCVN